MFYFVLGVVLIVSSIASNAVMDRIDIHSDVDNDELTLLDEDRYGADPFNCDTDSDGVPDGLDGWARD